jgi:hypothetical protein
MVLMLMAAKGVEVMQNASDIEKFSSLRAQFFQALHDNLGQRFPSENMLSAARAYMVRESFKEGAV